MTIPGTAHDWMTRVQHDPALEPWQPFIVLSYYDRLDKALKEIPFPHLLTIEGDTFSFTNEEGKVVEIPFHRLRRIEIRLFAREVATDG